LDGLKKAARRARIPGLAFGGVTIGASGAVVFSVPFMVTVEVLPASSRAVTVRVFGPSVRSRVSVFATPSTVYLRVIFD